MIIADLLKDILLISFPEKIIIVMFSIIILKELSVVPIIKVVNLMKFSFKNVIYILSISLIISIILGLLKTAFNNLLIEVVCVSGLTSFFICVFYKIFNIKHMLKVIMSVSFIVVFTVIIRTFYLVILDNYTKYTIELLNKNIDLKIVILSLERIMQLFLFLFLFIIIKKFGFVKLYNVKQIIENKFASVILLFFIGFNFITFIYLIYLSTNANIFYHLSFVMQFLTFIVILFLPFINIFSLFSIVYFISNQEIFDKISYEDRLILLTNFIEKTNIAINCIMDIEKLLNNMNNMIKDITKSDNSSIIVYDEETKKFKIYVTNIKDKKDLSCLEEDINSVKFIDVFQKDKIIIDNLVNKEIYKFTKSRDINSLVCLPIKIENAKFGFLLIESTEYNSFENKNIELLKLVGKQVAMILQHSNLYKKMQYMANIDNLTDVYNRHYFQEVLLSKFKNAKLYNSELCVAILDIDNFKSINDTYGHLFGDKVLKELSHCVKSSIRNTDILARYGGEEFVILFPNSDLDTIYSVADNLREKISQLKIYNNNEKKDVSITISIGISSSTSIENETILLDCADKSLYYSKRNGKNCVTKYDKNIII